MPTTPSTSTSHIVATSQQSRFHSETLDTSLEIDLKSVTIAIGQRELLTNSHLRLKSGVRYALMGRNGSGKSTLLKAIDGRLIPGIGKSIRILLLSQIQGEPSDTAPKEKKQRLKIGESKAGVSKSDPVEKNGDKGNTKVAATGDDRRVLDWVMEGDKTRTEAVNSYSALSKAIDTLPTPELHLFLLRHHLSQSLLSLSDAQELARRRSGARGWDARGEEVKAEEVVRQWEEKVRDMEGVLERGEVEEWNGEGKGKEVMDEALGILLEMQLYLDNLETAKSLSQASTILSGLGFTQQMMESPYADLSGGWRSRAQLGVALLIEGDVLMLDEPTNYLDLEAVLWLENYLLSQSRTIVLTSHDQDFLENVVQETIIIRNNNLKYFDGTPGGCEIQERKLRKRQMKQTEVLDRKRDHIEKSIKQGIASAKKTGDDNRMRMVKSRTKKLDERFGLEVNAKGHRFKLNRDMAGYHTSNRSGVEMEEQESFIKLKIDQPDPLRTVGNLLHLENVSYKWPKAKAPLFENVTLTLGQGERLSLIGQNGQGKSTLVKLIMGEIPPTSGTILRHPLMKIGYFSQHSVEALSHVSKLVKKDTTALSYFLDHFEALGTKVEEKHARAMLGSFGLPGRLAGDVPLLVLSGGQKVRLAFALLVYRPPHLLVLDEITTHLDLATIQALARALKNFSGGIVLVTHDRWLNRVVIEGVPFREASSAYANGDLSEDEDSSSESEGEVEAKKGETWRVDGGKTKLMTKGMTQYVTFVEKRLARKEKEADDAAAKR